MKKLMLFLCLLFGANGAMQSGFNAQKNPILVTIGVSVAVTLAFCKLYDWYTQPKKALAFAERRKLSETLIEAVPVFQIPVLQQDGSKPFTLHGKNIEEVSQGKILGIQGHTWKQVRTEESLNCGEHTLKNIVIMLEAFKDNQSLSADLELEQSMISSSLLNRERYTNALALMTPQIFEFRKNQANAVLGVHAIQDPGNSDEVKNARAVLKAAGNLAAEDIHASQGYIKTNWLSGAEMQKVLQNYAEGHAKDIFVLEYQPRMQGRFDQAFSDFTDSMENRLAEFKHKPNDALGICWTEDGYPHWIGFIAVKEQGTLRLYEMNSLSHLQPNYKSELVKLLK